MEKIMRKEGRRREREGKTCLLIDFKIVLIHFNAPHGPRLVYIFSLHAHSLRVPSRSLIIKLSVCEQFL